MDDLTFQMAAYDNFLSSPWMRTRGASVVHACAAGKVGTASVPLWIFRVLGFRALGL